MTADFIVLGSGSGGATVARRLCESGKFSVIQFEAGNTAKLNNLVNMNGFILGYLHSFSFSV